MLSVSSSKKYNIIYILKNIETVILFLASTADTAVMLPALMLLSVVVVGPGVAVVTSNP